MFPGCPAVSEVENAKWSLHYNEQSQELVATFTCLDDYVMFGNGTVVCDGERWIKSTFSCQSKPKQKFVSI